MPFAHALTCARAQSHLCKIKLEAAHTTEPHFEDITSKLNQSVVCLSTLILSVKFELMNYQFDSH